MSTSANSVGERVVTVRFDETSCSVDLVHGRTITAPIEWFPRLATATAEQRVNWQIAAGGYGIHWPDIDDDISVEGLLRGAPAQHVYSNQPNDDLAPPACTM
jgi:hypothetical protein